MPTTEGSRCLLRMWQAMFGRPYHSATAAAPRLWEVRGGHSVHRATPGRGVPRPPHAMDQRRKRRCHLRLRCIKSRTRYLRA